MATLKLSSEFSPGSYYLSTDLYCLISSVFFFSVTELVDESLSGPTLTAVGEGLTEEELELAKQILQVSQSVR